MVVSVGIARPRGGPSGRSSLVLTLNVVRELSPLAEQEYRCMEERKREVSDVQTA